MDNLSQLFEKDKSLKQFYINNHVQSYVKTNFDLFFGKLAKELHLLFVKDQILYLEAYNPMWMTEISFFEKEILKKINKELKRKEKILKIKLSLGKKTKSFTNLKSNKEEIKPLSFEEKIKIENDKRKQKGEVLCSRCNDVYTADDICVFCNAEGSYNKQ